MSDRPSRRTFLQAAGVAGGYLAGGRFVMAEKDVPLAPPDKQPPHLHLPDVPPRTVGWAVVGLGELALNEILPAFSECKLSRPVALVSGHPDKARRVAAAYGIDPRSVYGYDHYDRLADNDKVEVVYVVLPNSMHAEYTVRALKAGKHVLCEKPMATSADECKTMIGAARAAARKLMIAYRLHYEPFNRKAMDLCAKQAFGPLRTISASNCQSVQAPNIRLSRALGGGPLGDVGIYCLNAARYLTREDPVEVTAFARTPKNDPRFREVPAGVAFTLRFPSGVIAQCDGSFDSGVSRRFRVHCAGGWVELENAFDYRGQRLFTRKGEDVEEARLRPVNHFAAEMDHFSECVLTSSAPRTPGEEGLADQRIMDAINEAIRTGRAVTV